MVVSISKHQYTQHDVKTGCITTNTTPLDLNHNITGSPGLFGQQGGGAPPNDFQNRFLDLFKFNEMGGGLTTFGECLSDSKNSIYPGPSQNSPPKKKS